MAVAAQSALISSVLIGVLPILVLLPLPHVCPIRTRSVNARESTLNMLVSFAAGGLLGDSFLHLIPHALEQRDTGHSHSHTKPSDTGHSHAGQHVKHSDVGHSHADHDHHGHHQSDIGHCHAGDTGHCHASDTGHSHVSDTGHSHVSDTGHSHADDDHHGHHHDHSSTQKTMVLVLTGIGAFFVIHRLSAAHTRSQPNSNSHSHSHSLPHSSTLPSKGVSGGKKSYELLESIERSLVNIIADSSHNFTDGLAIAAAFSSSYKLGLTTSIAVFFHEIPHEIGDYGILLQNGMTHFAAIGVQLLTALACVSGTVMGIVIQKYQVDVNIAVWGLPLTAGGFIYIALADLTAGGFIYIALADVLAGLVHTDATLLEISAQVGCFACGIGMMSVVEHLEHVLE
ncbi:hypothetical protein AAMO2058_001725400 [Amorphochlora amoebiformis]